MGAYRGGEAVCPLHPPRSPPRGFGHQCVRAPRLCEASGVTMETERNAEKAKRGSAGSLAAPSVPSRTPAL